MADNLSGKSTKPKSSGIRRPGQASGRTVGTPKQTVSKPDFYEDRPNRPTRASVVQEEAQHRSTRAKPSTASGRRIEKQKSGAAPMQRRKVSDKDKTGFQKDVRAKRRNLAITILFIALLVLIVTFSGFLSYTYMTDNINNPISQDTIYLEHDTMVKFRVEKQESTRSISDRLYEMGLIKNKTMYRFLSKFNGYDGTYNAGTYTLSGGLSYEEIMYILSKTPPETVKVTFPEGFTTEQIAARLEANNLCSKQAFLDTLETIDISSYPFLQNIDFTTRDHRLDGYLFPDTYEFDVLSKPEELVYKMLDQFNAVFKPAYYDHLEELGLTLDQVVNLASMVEREAKLDSERSDIAGVFYNRYKKGLPETGKKYFESCATLRYVYKKLFNKDLINITKKDTETEDAYNTYLHEGFTPGPICSPGLASLEAALYPSNHAKYYFFVNPDGSGGHIFSATYAEHLAAQKGQQ